MPERSRPIQERYARVLVWLAAALRARTEGVPVDDHRIVWIREQAMICVVEGMPPWEAVQLAGDLAFRRYGLDPRN